MRIDVDAVAERGDEPASALAALASVSCVIERLRSDEEQRRAGIERRQRARQVLGIDIGDERDVDALRLRTGAASRAAAAPVRSRRAAPRSEPPMPS
jgi:hypothetical protein